jgi:hypothetical protein
MSIAEGILPEFDQEMATTRKLLERVPSDKGPWKPHPKSFPLGHLAQLVATMPGWLTQMLRATEINLATAPGYSFQTTEALLGEFDRHIRDAREALTAAWERQASRRSASATCSRRARSARAAPRSTSSTWSRTCGAGWLTRSRSSAPTSCTRGTPSDRSRSCGPR